MEKQEIGDILDRKPVEASEPSEQQTQTEAPDSGIQRDDRGRFASKGEKQETTEPTGEKTEQTPPPGTAPMQPPPGYVPLAALVDTRLEARQAKQQLAELQRQFEELRRPKPEPVDFFTDPDAAFYQRTQQMLNPFQNEITSLKATLLEERLYRLAGSEKAAKIEAEIEKALSARDPEVQALSSVVMTKGPAAIQDLIEWYDRRSWDPVAERELIRAEVEAERQRQAQGVPANVMPSNMANARNVGSRTGPMWSGPQPIGDIFRR